MYQVNHCLPTDKKTSKDSKTNIIPKNSCTIIIKERETRYIYKTIRIKDADAQTARHHRVHIINSHKQTTAYGTLYTTTQDRTGGSATFPTNLRTDVLPKS